MENIIKRGNRIILALSALFTTVMVMSLELGQYIELVDLFGTYLVILPVYVLFASLFIVIGDKVKQEPSPYFLIAVYSSFNFLYLSYLIHGSPEVGIGWIAPLVSALSLLVEARFMRQWAIDMQAE